MKIICDPEDDGNFEKFEIENVQQFFVAGYFFKGKIFRENFRKSAIADKTDLLMLLTGVEEDIRNHGNTDRR